MKIIKNFQFLMQALGQFRKNAFVLLGIIMIVSVTESLGLWMILPVLELVINPNYEAKSFSFLFDLLAAVKKENYLLVISLILLIIILVKSVFAMLQNYYMMKFVTDLRRYWEAKILDNYLHSRFDVLTKQKHGALLNNILNEPIVAAKAIRQGTDFLSKLILSIFILAMVLAVDWQITASLLAIICVFLAVIWKAMAQYSSAIGKKKIEINQSLNALASEFLHGIRQIKLFSVEDKAIAQFTVRLNELFKLIINFGVVSRLPNIFSELLMFVIIISVILYNRYISVTEITTILPLLGFFLASFHKLFDNLSDLVSQRMSILSYFPSLRLSDTIVKDRGSIENLEGDPVPEVFLGNLVFDNVSFGYGDQALFENLNLEIKRGEITALVGTSGSGKSTICNLIARFYVPTSGHIQVNGVDISDYGLKSWRGRIGYISQDTFLFDDTIRENVLVGKNGASDEEFMNALCQAGALEFVQNMPEKYDTVLGNSGINISGGQRQRIAIARALIRSSEFLILDESTSSLDAEVEGKIISFLDSYKRDRTILIVTHNVSTLRNADRIHVFDQGEIVESGRYVELINNDGLFSKLAQNRIANTRSFKEMP